MIVNHQRKAVFISTPKTGGTSIMMLLDKESVHQKPEVYHMTVAEALAQQPELAAYHFIGLARNPFDRAVSTFFDIILDRTHSGWVEDLPQSGPFGRFVKKIEREGSWDRIRHLWPQTRFYAAPPGVKVSVLPYEDYVRSAALVCAFFGVFTDKLGRYRETASRRKPYQHYLRRDTAAILARIYRDDIAAYGYDFDYERDIRPVTAARRVMTSRRYRGL